MRAAGPLLDDHGLFHGIVADLTSAGFAEEDLSWSESCMPPTRPEQFALETIFVICNSGMQNKVARMIFEKVRRAILEGRSAREEFGHPGKAVAIDDVWQRRVELMDGYLAADDKIAFCRSIPWIGGITCYHLAKNFGAQVAKPDVHLQRLAERHGTTCQDLCEAIAERTGFSVASVDLILWRACAERLIDGRTALPPVRITDSERKPAGHQHEMFQPVQQDLFD
jgi:hypothetical protein